MNGVAAQLAAWAAGLEPSPDDERLAQAALLDTLAVAVAAEGHPVLGPAAAELGLAGRLATAAHVLDFDDLHLPSTAHLSAVCVPVVLAVGGGARAYLAAAGAMARLGVVLGWEHYVAGWHATCTAGAPAAAAGAAVALGLDADGIARAMAHAVPAAGGVQRAFGTDAKSLQVGFAADAAVRAARLAAAGATADPVALDAWIALLGGDPARLDVAAGGEAVPGGLAVKLFPCCYALQRPMQAAGQLRGAVAPEGDVVVRTPASALTPLNRHAPSTGLEGKFSLEHGVAVALLDAAPGFAAFSDAGVRRPEVRALAARVRAEPSPGGAGLLAGDVEVEVPGPDGPRRARLDAPLGSPARPAGPEDLRAKLELCAGDRAAALAGAGWDGALAVLGEAG